MLVGWFLVLGTSLSVSLEKLTLTVRHSSFIKTFAENWEYTPDIEISTGIFSYLAEHPDEYSPPSHTTSQLCSRCAGINLLSPSSRFSDTVAGLAEKKPNCDLCTLLYWWCLRSQENHPDIAIEISRGLDNRVIEFSRAESYLATGTQREQRVASLNWAQNVTYSQGVQRGFPVLPELGGTLHMKILSLWLEACDRKHTCFPKSPVEFLPTRLIDVSPDISTDAVHLLYSTSSLHISTRYLALSHRWGPPRPATPSTYGIAPSDKSPLTRTIRTTQLEDTISESGSPLSHREIPIASLPATFRDAVLVTRGLGIRYLWIDSLCIIQNSPEDWARESARMECVFSGAYCTIAATSASGTDDGFLRPRPERVRHVVVLPGGGSTPEFYVSEMVDDFDEHVGRSELQSRGWVLQERALSRRTIHFAGRQTYWECGGGVRCETLTKMNNDKAAFLGDADFPSYADRWSKGKRIKVIQGLYEQYSAMGLTYARDRPAAIRGLETRLIKTIGGPGGFGIFRQHMHRYLLWRRATSPKSGNSLERVTDFLPPSIPPPSWSWMAYSGVIKYVDVPGVGVQWDSSIVWPASSGGSDSDDATPVAHLEAPVWDLVLDDGVSIKLDGEEHEEGWILMDSSSTHMTVSKPTKLKCVVVGTSLKEIGTSYCWVLIVGPVSFSVSDDGDHDEPTTMATMRGAGLGMGNFLNVIPKLKTRLKRNDEEDNKSRRQLRSRVASWQRLGVGMVKKSQIVFPGSESGSPSESAGSDNREQQVNWIV